MRKYFTKNALVSKHFWNFEYKISKCNAFKFEVSKTINRRFILNQKEESEITINFVCDLIKDCTVIIWSIWGLKKRQI